MNSLTLFADASFCPDTKAAGWGCWAKRREWTRGAIFGGRFKTPMGNASRAELCALANALTVLHNEGSLKGITAVWLQSDNLRALELIGQRVPQAEITDTAAADVALNLKRKHPTNELDRKALDLIADILGNLGVTLKHIRAHQGDGVSGRSWVNEVCDRTAKKHMRRHRAEIKRARTGPKRKKHA